MNCTPQEITLAAYLSGHGQWKGCHWRTSFGPTGLDLNGFASSQALVLARATSGEESSQWKAAATWLKQLESDAQEAEKLASRAMAAIAANRAIAARELARQAVILEQAHHQESVWQPLLDAIEKLCVERDGAAGPPVDGADGHAATGGC